MSMKIVSALALLLSANLANAMDGVFDRSAEINNYVTQLNSSATRNNLYLWREQFISPASAMKGWRRRFQIDCCVTHHISTHSLAHGWYERSPLPAIQSPKTHCPK